MVNLPELGPGELGFINASIKSVADCRVGDTITDDRRPAAKPLPGFKPSVPVVFCGLFPVDAADSANLRASLATLALHDSSFLYDAESRSEERRVGDQWVSKSECWRSLSDLTHKAAHHT